MNDDDKYDMYIQSTKRLSKEELLSINNYQNILIRKDLEELKSRSLTITWLIFFIVVILVYKL
jgi:hypothetical protein